MKSRLRPLLPVALLATLAATSAHAGPVVTTFSSDAAFNASAGFTKLFGGTVRWARGDGGTGDWEYSIVDATDVPVPDQARQAPTSFLTSQQAVLFTWNRPAVQASLALSTLPSSTGRFSGGPVDTIAVRAFASAGRSASLSRLTVTFTAGGPPVMLDPLAGDDDGEYIVLQDARIGDGFSVSTTGRLVGITGSGGSDPLYQFKVGNTTVIPVPGAMPLLLSGLAVFGWLQRRRFTH